MPPLFKKIHGLCVKDEVNALAVTEQETDTDVGDVSHPSGSFLGYMGENYFLLM